MAASRWVVDKIQSLQTQPERLRAVGICAHVDHGKSTLTDSLLAGSGLVDSERAGALRVTDTREDEKARGITIKSTGATGYYELVNHATGETEPFVLNLIDTPGHVDFSSEVTAALRVTDGAIVVVDAVEGVSVQTQTVMRQALSELVRPALCINKVDRFITELQLEPEAAYQRFARIVEQTNELIAGFAEAAANAELVEVPSGSSTTAAAGASEAGEAAAAAEAGGSSAAATAAATAAAIRNSRVLAAREFTEGLVLDPRKGNVVFASGKQGWAFSLEHWARVYTARYGSTVETWQSRLWGDFFWDETAKRFYKSPTNPAGERLPRAFCHFVLRPVWAMFETMRGRAGAGLEEQLAEHGVVLKGSELTRMHEHGEYVPFLEKIMRRWLPASTALAELAVRHLPSPKEAQRYRTAVLYEGPPDDECAVAMRACDHTGPLMMYISKMVPVDQGFFAFGRVFSGSLSVGSQVRILGPEYRPGSDRDSASAKVSQVAVWMAARTEAVESVPAGNTAGIQGIERWVVKTATITTSAAAHSIAPMRMSVSPVVRVAIRPAAPSQMAAFRDGMAKLARADSMVQFTKDAATGEDIMCGVGALHLSILLADLEGFAKGKVLSSPPVVSYRETVLAPAEAPILKKSSNKHNRVFMGAGPVAEGFAEAVDAGTLTEGMDRKEMARVLTTSFGFDKTDIKNLLAFGGASTESAANLFVNVSKGVAYVHEASPALVDGYRMAVAAGPLCGEPLRGARVTFDDGLFHAEGTHRAPRFIEPASRQAIHGALLAARPRLLEPIYEVVIVAPPDALGAIFSVLAPRRGVVIGQEQKEGSPLFKITAHLPVATSFDFHEALLDQTSGKAFPSMSFSHWALIDSDPLEPGSEAAELVLAIRRRKGMPETLPSVDDFRDRL